MTYKLLLLFNLFLALSNLLNSYNKKLNLILNFKPLKFFC